MVLDALAEVLADMLLQPTGAFLGDLRGGRVPGGVAVQLRRARRRAATGRPVVLPVRVRYRNGGRRRRRWSRALVRTGVSAPELGVGRRWARRWIPLPGTGGYGSAEAVDGQADPHGWPVLLLTALGQPDCLMAAHPLVLRFLAQMSGVPLRGLDLGPADRSATPRHRAGRSGQ